MNWNAGTHGRAAGGRYRNRHERRATRQLRRSIGLGTWRPLAWLGPLLVVMQVIAEKLWRWLLAPIGFGYATVLTALGCGIVIAALVAWLLNQ